MATIYVSADRRIVPAGSPDAVRGVAECDIDREGLRAAYDEFMAPPEAPKQAPKAANKMLKPASNKSRKGGR